MTKDQIKKPTFKENVDSFVTQTSKIIRFPKDVIEYIKSFSNASYCWR